MGLGESREGDGSFVVVCESELIQSSGVSRPLTDPPAPVSQDGPSSGCVRTCLPARFPGASARLRTRRHSSASSCVDPERARAHSSYSSVLRKCTHPS